MSTSNTLAAAKKAGRAALVAYLPIGYPTLPDSVAAIQAVIGAGADIVEVGIPYSDPVMDGPVIQRATEQALAGGARPRDVFSVVEQCAGRGADILVMTYWNPVFRYGAEHFARDLASAGGTGMITPDLIPEEAGEWIAAADDHNLDKVFLVAPTSTPRRLAITARAARGFVYAAATMGVTGARESIASGAQRLVAATRAAGAQNVCVGIGVSTPQQAGTVAHYADGVIVGSALVAALGEGIDALVDRTSALAASLRSK